MPLPGGVFLDLFECGYVTTIELCSDVEEFGEVPPPSPLSAGQWGAPMAEPAFPV